MVKRITRARISFLSLVPKGANRLPGLYKSDDDTLEWSPLYKVPDDFEEKGQLTALVYVPEHQDSHEHVASKEVIADMAHSFMEEGAKIDIRHNRKELKKDAAYIAESFIVQKDDPRFIGLKDHLGKAVDATDGWGVVMQINDSELRKAYREGGWDGVSLYSYAGDYTLANENDAVGKALEEFQRRLLKTEEIDMDSKELAELLKENNKSLVESLATILKKEPEGKKPEGKKPEEKPVEKGYQGDPTDIDALVKYQQELEVSALKEKYDFSKPEEVKEYIAKVEEIKKADNNDPQGDPEDEDKDLKEQISKLEKELKAGKKRSRTTTTKAKGESRTIDGLSKEENEAFAAGLEIADISNKNRGYTS